MGLIGLKTNASWINLLSISAFSSAVRLRSSHRTTPKRLIGMKVCDGSQRSDPLAWELLCRTAQDRPKTQER